MNLKSLAFGLSEYVFLDPTSYADRDAEEFYKAINEFHGPSLNQLFLNMHLTKTLFLKRFKEFCSDLTENTHFYFFYAGHGCNYQGNTYLSCFDSEKNDIETWVSIEEMLSILANTNCKKIIFFLDCCQDELRESKTRGQLLDQLDWRESFKIQDQNKYQIILFSSSIGEMANVRDSKKHGIWSYFLIQALRGENEGRDALNSKHELYLNQLHEYLHLKVKDFYRGIGKPPRQSSMIKGEFGIDPFITAFLPAHIEKYEVVPNEFIPKIRFETVFDKKVKDLQGFNKKTHKVPNYFNNTASSWVKKIGDEDIQDIMDNDSEKIIKIFDLDPALTIKEGGVEIERSDELGLCSLKCKYFEYSIMIDYQSNDLQNVSLIFTLNPLDQDKLFQLRENLDQCFTYWFDSMIMDKNIGNAKLLYGKIKKVSEDKTLPFSFKYIPVNESVELLFSDGRTFQFTNHYVKIEFKSSEAIDEMFESLTEISNEILQIDSSIKLLG